MTDIIKSLEKHARECSRVSDADTQRLCLNAAEEITRLRARVAELEAGDKVAGYLCSHKMQCDLGTWFSRFDQSAEYIVATPVYTAPQPADNVVKDAKRYEWLRNNPNYEARQYTGTKTKRVKFVCKPLSTNYEYTLYDTLDAAIDAAMKGDASVKKN